MPTVHLVFSNTEIFPLVAGSFALVFTRDCESLQGKLLSVAVGLIMLGFCASILFGVIPG
jgi:hypothetical protein